MVPLHAGLAVLRAFYERLTPTTSQLEPQLDAAGKPTGNFKVVGLFKKRGLTIATCEALGFRANPRTNEAILREFFDLYPWADLVASGLWLGADAKRKLPRRPNTQFCGKGTVGKIPKTDRKSTEDKFIWGWCEPVLIPTFDNLGQLIFPVAPFVLPAWQPWRRGRGAGVVGSVQRTAASGAARLPVRFEVGARRGAVFFPTRKFFAPQRPSRRLWLTCRLLTDSSKLETGRKWCPPQSLPR